MAYASYPDVEALNQQRTFTANSKPTKAEVGDFLTRTAAELDGIFAARGYSTPVPTTATGAFELARYYNALGAACLVEQAAEQSDRREQACKAWQAARDALRAGEIELPDAGRDTANSLVRYATAPTAVFTATTAW